MTVIGEDVQVADVQQPASAPLLTERAFADLLRPLIDPGFRLALAMLHDAHAAEVGDRVIALADGQLVDDRPAVGAGPGA